MKTGRWVAFGIVALVLTGEAIILLEPISNTSSYYTDSKPGTIGGLVGYEPSASVSSSPTSSSSESATNSATATETSTATATETSTATDLSTASPTSSATPTTDATPTASSTTSATETATASASETTDATPTASSTTSATETATATASATPTRPIAILTATPQATLGNSHIPSGSPSQILAGATSSPPQATLNRSSAPSRSPGQIVAGATGTPPTTATSPDLQGRGRAPLTALLISLIFGAIGLLAIELAAKHSHLSGGRLPPAVVGPTECPDDPDGKLAAGQAFEGFAMPTHRSAAEFVSSLAGLDAAGDYWSAPGRILGLDLIEAPIVAPDGSVHGEICLNEAGEIACEWPEQHGWAYEPGRTHR